MDSPDEIPQTPATIRVLVADDDPFVRDALKLILSLEDGFEVVGAAQDGQEAVALARRFAPSAIIMDVRMPGMDGVAATRLIMSEAPQTVIVGLTALDTDSVRQEMFSAGAAEVIMKVDGAEKLAPAIRRLISGLHRN